VRLRTRRAVPIWERDLILRLLTTVLREDVAGVRTRGRPVTIAPGEKWLVLHHLWLPVRGADADRGDLVTDLAARAPFLLRITPGRRVRVDRLPAVLGLLSRDLVRGIEADPVLAAELTAGFAALRQEAVAASMAAELRRRRRPLVLGRLRSELVGETASGWAAAIGYETLAAQRDHPFYPFSVARVGLSAEHVLRSAPEHRPDLVLRWLMLPSSSIEQQGRLPGWWPSTDGADQVALPVHPALSQAALERALAEAGIEPDLRRAPLEPVRPTLSMRTVVPVRHPEVHLKLPLPMRTLGRLNLRTIARPGLADGALIGRVLGRILVGEPGFADTVRIADESTWLHAGHPLLAVLIRRWEHLPAGAAGTTQAATSTDAALDDAVIVPVAGLAGLGTNGRPLLVELADRFADGDLDRLLGQYLRLLIEWQVTLWLRYGIVLEAHPQNVLIAVDRTDHGPRVRLLFRDLDSAKLDLELLATGLGHSAPTSADLSDQRVAARDPGELLDLFVTTTLHQCVAAVLIDCATALNRPVGPLLALIRPLLTEAAGKYPDARDTPRLRAGILEARRLPVKRALTAATLLPKTRTGAADVNKYYGADAPSYL
jgi:siderophore synthetase component